MSTIRFYLTTFKVLTLLCLYAILATPLWAEITSNEIAVKDTSGFTRAVAEVDGMGSVEFTLVDADGNPADGVEVTLTSALSGETISAVAINGIVLFENIVPGVWTVASTVPGVTFTNVTIASMSAAGAGMALGGVSATTAQTAGAIVILGGATAWAISETNSSGNGEEPLSPAS